MRVLHLEFPPSIPKFLCDHLDVHSPIANISGLTLNVRCRKAELRCDPLELRTATLKLRTNKLDVSGGFLRFPAGNANLKLAA